MTSPSSTYISLSLAPTGGHITLKSYSLLTGFALCINMIIGTGVFNLPYAIFHGGIGLSVGLILVCAFFSWMCLVWFLEICARAEGIASAKKNEPPLHQITMRKFDINQLCELFYGFKGKLVCQMFLFFYCYGLLWAYSAVFSNSVNDLFWEFTHKIQCSQRVHDLGCTSGYYICLVIYGLIVIPISLLNVTEQAIIQVILTCYRFVAFGVMCATVIFALSYPLNPFNQINPHGQVNQFDWLNWSGFAGIFTTSAVALNFHFTIPDLVKPVAEKKYLVHMTSASLVVATSFYILVAILCALYFGSSVSSLVTLNWQKYTGMEGGWGGDFNNRPWWAVMIQLVVMLFPILDMLSVFPLIGVSLGDNLLKMFPSHSIFQVFSSGKILFGTLKKDVKISRTLCRLISTIPPILLAAAAGNLDQIFKFAGLFAFFLQLILPCMLQLKSKKVCTEIWGPNPDYWKTTYTLPISHNLFVVITLIFSTLALLFAIFDFIVGVAQIKLW